MRGVGGAAINVPDEGAGAGENASGTGLRQIAFEWWNAAVPLIAILGLFGLSRMRFGISTEELKSDRRGPEPRGARRAGSIVAGARDFVARQAARPASPVPVRPAPSSGSVRPPPPTRPGAITEARLTTVNPIDPVPAEYALLKDEISLGRGEDNDVVIPDASISRAHARLMRRDGAYELTDLNSTNGSYVNDATGNGSVPPGFRVAAKCVSAISSSSCASERRDARSEGKLRVAPARFIPPSSDRR